VLIPVLFGGAATAAVLSLLPHRGLRLDLPKANFT
jgi:hypothetical protein